MQVVHAPDRILAVNEGQFVQSIKGAVQGQQKPKSLAIGTAVLSALLDRHD